MRVLSLLVAGALLLPLAARADDPNSYAQPDQVRVRAFMSRIGRIYLTTPVYKAFVATPEGLADAQANYAEAKAGYHPLTQAAIERIFARQASASR